MAARKEFDYESLQDSQAIVAYLGALGEGLAKGDLVLGANGDELSLHPRGLLRFRLEAKRSKGRARLSLTLSWREDQEQSDQDGSQLEINPRTPSSD